MGVNIWKIFRDFHSKGYGSSHVFTGIQAGLASRLSFLTARNLIYKIIYDIKKPVKATNDLGYREKIAISAFAGAIGAIVSNPFEIMKIRQIADLGRSEQFKRGYNNIPKALESIGSELKGSGMWRGLFPNILRMSTLGAVMIYPYDRMKEHSYVTFGDVFVNPIVGLVSASIWGTIFTLPIDNIRTRIMNQYPEKSLNRYNYNTIMGVINQALKVEGLSFAFVGMYPHFLHTLFYATFTLYLTDAWLTARKRGQGLPEHKI